MIYNKGIPFDILRRISYLNIRRMRIISWIILLCTPLFITRDYFHLKETGDCKLYFQIDILARCFLAVCCLALLYSCRAIRSSDQVDQRHFYLVRALFILSLFSAAVFTGFSYYWTDSLLPYLLAVFIASAFLNFRNFWTILSYGLGAAVLVGILVFMEPSWDRLPTLIIDLLLLSVMAILVSGVVFSSQVKNIRAELLIIEQKEQLEESNRRLTQSNQVLKDLSYLDPLTKVPNRRYYDHAMQREWRAAQRNGGVLSLIMADIDNFKSYNDTYGHQSGDYCLSGVASALHRSLMRPGDTVARYGGEEFVALLPDTDMEGALTVARRMMSQVEDLHVFHAGSPSGLLTVSLGVSTHRPKPVEDPQMLLNMADQALYLAKENGRNRVETMTAEKKERPLED